MLIVALILVLFSMDGHVEFDSIIAYMYMSLNCFSPRNYAPEAQPCRQLTRGSAHISMSNTE